MDYYVYVYLREDGSPYYVGKGRNRRAYDNHGHVPVPSEDRIRFHAKNLTEDAAFELERRLIEKYGRKLDGGILINLAAGGGGSSGYKMTPEQRANVSAALKGNKRALLRKSTARSEECRRKISEKNKGNKYSLGVKHPPRSKDWIKKQSVSQGKLTVEQVLEIRELAKTTNGNRIAKMYGLSRSSVYDIIQRKSYKMLG